MGNTLFQLPMNPDIRLPIKHKSAKNLPPNKNSNYQEMIAPKLGNDQLKQKSNLSPIVNNNINSEIKNIFSQQIKKSRKLTFSGNELSSAPCNVPDSQNHEEFLEKKSLSESNGFFRPGSFKSLSYNDYELHFYRNEDEIRSTYFAKLIYKKILSSQTKKKIYNSIIIFDWDDTLLCTSFLASKNLLDVTSSTILTKKEQEKISTLENSVLKLLTNAVEKGDVYIITNAEYGWVEFSASKYYPKILDVLKKINIISAREKYSKYYPNDSQTWKIHTFLDITKGVNSDLITNVICMGDSFIEIEAGNKLREQFVQNQAFVKTIKFRESPKPEELNKQLTLINEQFHDIYSSIKNLTIYIERKKKMSC